MSPNPFLWPGPQFLGFYLVLIALCWTTCRLWLYSNEHSASAKALRDGNILQDPYRLAYLRGAEPEVLKVATFSLLQQDLLKMDDNDYLYAEGFSINESSLWPAERAVLARYRKEHTTVQALLNTDAAWLRTLCEPYRNDLEQAGLMVRSDGKARLFFRVLTWTLLAIAVIKIAVALATGHFNVLLLIGLLVLFRLSMRTLLRGHKLFPSETDKAPAKGIGSLLWPMRHRQTGSGARLVKEQQVLFSALRVQADRDGVREPHDALWLASAYGVAALSLTAFPFIAMMGLPPSAMAAASGAASSGYTCSTTSNCSSGSSCSSSSCSSSSCGGGCGGCGGGGD